MTTPGARPLSGSLPSGAVGHRALWPHGSVLDHKGDLPSFRKVTSMNHRTTTGRTAVSALAVGVAATLIVAGCGAAPAPTAAPLPCDAGAGPVGLAVGQRQNTPAVRIDGTVRAVLTHAVEAAAPVTVVAVDGAPAAVRKFPTVDLPNSSAAAAEAVTEAVTAVTGAVSGVRAAAPEADVLAALAVTADAVRAAGTEGTVVLMDSGLQTVAPLDFTRPGVLAADPADLVQFLRASGQLPDLSGTAVLYAGLGATAAPQARLTDSQVAHLEALYRAVAEASGARCVAVVDLAPSTAAVGDVPPVSPVPVPAPVSVTVDTGPIVLDATTVAFHPDTADLVDPAAADQVLAPLIARLSEEPERTVTLIGTCASGTGTGPDPVALSGARADTVAGRLITAGIAPHRITTYGVGTAFAQFVIDLDADGTLLPGPAAQNRTVRITVH